MNQLLPVIGRVIGGIGVIVCILAVLLRLSGLFYVIGVSTGALLQIGMSGVLIGCFFLLLANTTSH